MQMCDWPNKNGRLCVWQLCSVANVFISLRIYYFVMSSVGLLFNVFIVYWLNLYSRLNISLHVVFFFSVALCHFVRCKREKSFSGSIKGSDPLWTWKYVLSLC